MSTALAFTCSTCDNTWTGLRTCHCSGCHRTFSGVTLFDMHRKLERGKGICVNPAELEISGNNPVTDSDGIWRWPTDPDRPNPRVASRSLAPETSELDSED